MKPYVNYTCPTCGSYVYTPDWAGNCECNTCGAEWNEIERGKKERAKKRGAYMKEHGVEPIFEPKKRYNDRNANF